MLKKSARFLKVKAQVKAEKKAWTLLNLNLGLSLFYLLQLPLRSRVGTMVCQPTLIGKADIASIADDEMVKNPNTQDFPC